MLHIAIVEDEIACAMQLAAHTERWQQETGIACETEQFTSGTRFLADYQPQWDLILLDIEMPGKNGIETAKQIRKVDPDVLILFVTNMAKYAIFGYEVNALDYMLKPVAYPAFALKMQKVLRSGKKVAQKQLILKREGATLKMPLSDIFYIETYGHELCYHTKSGRFTFTGDRTLRQLAEDLRPYHFALCNQCYLVNLWQVSGVRQDCAMVNGTALKISRNKQKPFMQALMQCFRGGAS